MSPLKNAMHMREMPKLYCAVEKARGKETEATSNALCVSVLQYLEVCINMFA